MSEQLNYSTEDLHTLYRQYLANPNDFSDAERGWLQDAMGKSGMRTQGAFDGKPPTSPDDDLRQLVTMYQKAPSSFDESELAWMRSALQQRGLDPDTALRGTQGGAFTRGMRSGVTLNFDDELGGALAYLDPNEDYADRRDRIRRAQDARRFMYPDTTLAGEVTGGLATAAVPIGGTALAAGRGARALTSIGARATATGAAEGAASGFGSQRGSNNPLSAEVGTGAAGGAVFGLGGGLVGEFLGRGLSRLSKRSAPKLRETVGAELQRIAKVTGMSPDEIISRAAQDESFAAQVSDNKTFQQLIKSWYRGASDDVRAQVSATLQRRSEEAPSTIVRAFEERLGRVPTERGSAEERIFPASREWGEAYEASPAVETDRYLADLQDLYDFTPGVIGDLNTQARLGAAARARETGTAMPKGPLLAVDENGAVQFTRTPTAPEIDYLERQLRRNVDAGYNPSSGPVKVGELEFNQSVQRSVRKNVDENLPPLANVRAREAQANRAMEAYDAARAIGTGSRNIDEFLSGFRQMDDISKDHARAGIVANLAPQLRNLGPTATATVDKLVDTGALSRPYAELIREVFPNDEALQRTLRTALGNRRAGAAISTGSDTALLQTDDLRRAGARDGMLPIIGTAVLDVTTGSGGAITAGALTQRFGSKLIDNLRRGAGFESTKDFDQALQIFTRSVPDADAMLKRALTGDVVASRLLRTALASIGTRAAGGVGEEKGVAGLLDALSIPGAQASEWDREQLAILSELTGEPFRGTKITVRPRAGYYDEVRRRGEAAGREMGDL